MGIGLFPALAAAQTTVPDEAPSRQLFREGREHLAAGRIAEACAAFERSAALEPAPGTLLNLAVCHEQQGRTATAWAEFNTALAQARRDARADRVALAEEHLRALEPKLSTLVLEVSSAADVPGLEIRRDGAVVPRAAWGKPLPLDPGQHELAVSAPGRRPFQTTLQLAAEGDRRSLSIPVLEAAAVPAPTPATSVAAAPAPRDEPTSSGNPGMRTAAIVAGAVGVAGIGVGTAFGLSAIDKREQSDAECPNDICSAAGVELNESAKRSADVATVAFAVGGASLVTGALLWIFSAGSSKSAEAGAHPLVGARLATTGGAIELRGRF